MYIDVPDALSMEGATLDEGQDFTGISDNCSRQIQQQFHRRRSIVQTAAGNLADHERMHDDQSLLEQRRKQRVSLAKVVYPD